MRSGKRRALFPISLSNDTFSTRNVTPAIEQVANDYDEIFLLIADRIQIFNHVAKALHPAGPEKAELLSFAKIEATIERTFIEREKWLDRIKLEMGARSLHLRWKIYGMRSLSDKVGFEILRRVLILYDIDRQFRADVDDWAMAFVRHPHEAPQGASEDRRRLSIRYILEEAAISLRIRVHHLIVAEFYIGRTTEPIANIYRGKYRCSCWELAGAKPRSLEFQFFENTAYRAGYPSWQRFDASPAT